MGTPHAGAVHPGAASMADANGSRRETKQGYDHDGRDETRQPPLWAVVQSEAEEELANAEPP